MGTNGAPMLMIASSASAIRSSHACSASPHGTSMQPSPIGWASSPAPRNSCNNRSRSGIRAASTCTVSTSLIEVFCPPECGWKPGGPGRRLQQARPTRYAPPAMAVATEREYGLFINGESSEPASREIRELKEPATGESLARVAVAGEADVDRAVEAAQSALAGEWGKTPPTERSRLLHALADAIQANRKELAELEVRNVGKAISSVKAELAQGVENFRFYASAIASIAGRSNPIGGSLLFFSLKEPVGVAGQIVPWNYPLMMTTWKLAPALAAGCTVVLKPDPATPLSALRLAELATEAGFPPGTINVVPGSRPVLGAHLVTHPGVEYGAFTGSTPSLVE